MSQFKDWKDGEKLTGVDYTYERKAITNKAENINADADAKASQRMVLSETVPDSTYIGHIWMNPNDFTYNYFEHTIEVDVEISGFRFTAYDIPINQTIQVDSAAQGFKTEMLEPVFINDTVTVSASPEGYKEEVKFFPINDTITVVAEPVGYKEQVLFFPINDTITVSVEPTGYKEQILFFVVEDTITVIAEPTGYKEEINFIPVNHTIATDVSPTGYKEEINFIPINDTITVNASAEGFKQQVDFYSISKIITTTVSPVGEKVKIEFESINDTITVSASAAGFKPDIKFEPINDTVTVSASPTGYKEQIKFEPVNDTITVSASPTGFKPVVEFVPINDTITVSASPTGFKPLVEFIPINDTITLSASAEGYKSYEIFARSDAPFSTNFTFDGVSTTVSIPQQTYEVIGDLGGNEILGVSVPSEIVVGTTRYEYVNTTFLIGSSSPGTRTDTSFTLSIFGTTYLNFNYEPVPVINVFAKMTDVTAGAFIEQNVTFSTLNASNIVIDSDVQPVEPQYAQKYTMEDVLNYKLRVNTPASFLLNSKTYVIDRIDFLDDTQQYITGTTAQELTYAIGPSVQDNVYVHIQYKEQPFYLLRAALSSTFGSQFATVTATTIFSTGVSPVNTTLSRLGVSDIGTRVSGTTYSISVPSQFTDPSGNIQYFQYWECTIPSGLYPNGAFGDNTLDTTGLTQDTTWIARYGPFPPQP